MKQSEACDEQTHKHEHTLLSAVYLPISASKITYLLTYMARRGTLEKANGKKAHGHRFFTLLYFTLMARKGAPLGKPEKAHGFQSEPGARVLSRSSLFCEQKLVFL